MGLGIVENSCFPYFIAGKDGFERYSARITLPRSPRDMVWPFNRTFYSVARGAMDNEFHQCTIQNNKNKRPSGISLPLMRSSMCMSKSGLTLHRMSRHGYQPTRAHTSQRDECEETALHLLSCPALHPLRVQFAIVDDVPLMKLCFSKRLAQFFIAVERNFIIPQFSQPRETLCSLLPIPL
ncbi:Tbingi protein [Trypanosoma theileri]|uniref:Tbingi protein n=1 Tax=Trypanosoma theileri TaxID=67003 RepID=A0A1X0NEQ2_9TRYP|nr:Tbingi protein [Trypanosoma theileri]ORC82349.1 Tbingi protein [Trypanosoma theileri]